MALLQIKEGPSILALARDISMRKETEAALKQLNEELEKRVKERTAELEAKNVEQERLNQLFVGRELKMVDLKKQIKELEKENKRKDQ